MGRGLAVDGEGGPFTEIQVAVFRAESAVEFRAGGITADFFSAPTRPAGLRVNCTAEASARNSRSRLMAPLIILPKKVPTEPSRISARPLHIASPPTRFCASRPAWLTPLAIASPVKPITRMPWTIATSRVLRRMSPL